MHSLSPSGPVSLDWSASSPFLAEVYDEQQLLQQRDMLYRRREEMRKRREKLKQQQQQQRIGDPVPARDRMPNLIREEDEEQSNPLIPKPVIEEYDHRIPAASHKRTAPGSESSYIAEDTRSSDREAAAVREIPVSSFESYNSRQQQGRESEQGLRSPEAIHLHYFSRVRHWRPHQTIPLRQTSRLR